VTKKKDRARPGPNSKDAKRPEKKTEHRKEGGGYSLKRGKEKITKSSPAMGSRRGKKPGRSCTGGSAALTLRASKKRKRHVDGKCLQKEREMAFRENKVRGRRVKSTKGQTQEVEQKK